MAEINVGAYEYCRWMDGILNKLESRSNKVLTTLFCIRMIRLLIINDVLHVKQRALRVVEVVCLLNVGSGVIIIIIIINEKI